MVVGRDQLSRRRKEWTLRWPLGPVTLGWGRTLIREGLGSMNITSDAELLAKVASGDRYEAVGLLYDRHGAAVWNAALAALGDPQQTDEITVHVFQWMTRHAGRLAAVDRPLDHLLRLEATRVGIGMLRHPVHGAVVSPPVGSILGRLARDPT